MKAIVTSINGHHYLEFDYEGYPRKVIPFAYGNHISTRNKVMRALQVAGSSSSGKFDFPKLFTVDEMSNVIVSAETFVAPESYTKNDSHISPIDVEL